MIEYKKYKLPDGSDTYRTEYTDELGRFHRVDGPAIVMEFIMEAYYKDGKLHREGNEPATIDFINNYRGYFIDGVCQKTTINWEVKYERGK